MAATTTSLVSLANAVEIKDTALGAAPDNDVNVGAATLYLVQVDNSANPTQKVYLKLYNNVAPTVGTTAPDKIIPAPGGTVQQVYFPEGIAFGTSLSMACVTAGGTGGAGAPTSSVVVTLVITP